MLYQIQYFEDYIFLNLLFLQLKLLFDLKVSEENQFFSYISKKITLKKNVKEIYFRRDKNQCQICRRTFNPEKLFIKFKDPHMKDKYDWNNVYTCCQGCKSKQIIKPEKIKKIINKIDKEEQFWEYKEIKIKKVVKIKSVNNLLYSQIYNNEDIYEIYYEFDAMDGKGWFHLIDNKKQISSRSLADILNHFGADGWELVSLIKEEHNNTDYGIITRNKLIEVPEEFYCVFKKKDVAS